MFLKKVSVVQLTLYQLLNLFKIMTIGLGIITYNREIALKSLLNSLYLNGVLDQSSNIIVCDDCSSYDIKSLTNDYNVKLVQTKGNMGVVYSKNNALYNLFEKQNCDNVLLLEDDVICISNQLLPLWDNIINIFNHVNYLHPHDFDKYYTYEPDKVYLTPRLTAQAMGISRKVFDDIGYFNPLFKGYGYGHTEYSERALRMGYGGKMFKYYATKGFIQPNEIFDSYFDGDNYTLNKLKYLNVLSNYKIKVTRSDVEEYLS